MSLLIFFGELDFTIDFLAVDGNLARAVDTQFDLPFAYL